MSEPYRTEHDSMGEIRVPADHLWGAQTERSRQNFPIGLERHRWGREVIRALGTLKQAAAQANAELGTLPAPLADAIARAAREVADGLHDAEFPLSVFQTGSGTQTNMNANEVIAHLAGRITGAPVHPNDHVNRSQSSNDAFPTVMHLATVRALRTTLLPALHALRQTLEEKSATFADIVMIGRTHLQDATPITLGQIISGWVAQLDAAHAGIEATFPALLELAIGGTAVGTGLNAPPGFGAACARRLALQTGEAFTPAANYFAALSAHDAIVAASAALRTLAGALLKIANDVRWYASGPRAGIGELRIPENEPGSSIMPGKVNPTQCEALAMVCVQVFGNDAATAFAGSQGNFQLNVFKPVMLSNMLDSAGLLADAITGFDTHCARGIEPDFDRITQHLNASLMLVTALAPHIGYERAASIARTAHLENLTLRAVATREITPSEFDAWVRPEEMTRQA